MTPIRRVAPVHWSHLVLLWAGLMVVVFGGCEIAERLWILPAHPGWLSEFHLLRGIGTSLLATALVVAYLLRRSVPLFADPTYLYVEPAPRADLRDQQEGFRRHAAWLIQSRWAVLTAGMGLVLIACPVTGLLPGRVFLPLMGCLGGMLAANLVLAWASPGVRHPQRFLFLQMIMDLAAFTACLALSGGIENPLAVAILLHVVLAAILLPRLDALRMSAAAAVLVTLLTAGELVGSWEHIPLRLTLDASRGSVALDPLYAVSHLLALVVMLASVTWVVTAVMARLRAMEAALARAGQMASIGELSARIAHEINNPAGIVKAKARLMQMAVEGGRAPERLPQELDKIARQADRIAQITQGLLSFCRPSLGERAPQDLNAIVTEVLGLVDHTLRMEGIRPLSRLAPDLPPVLGNRNELQQVLLNLVSNAVDAMRGGGTITLETDLDGGGEEAQLLVSVADTGHGIPPDLLERIFLPFYTTKAEGKGTGLGLSITLGIVRSHGGGIQVESVPGKGSRFIVRLPAASPVAEGSLR